MALTYDKTQRDLSIKGVLTLNTSDQVYLTDEDIVSYSINASVGAEGIPLGTVESASYTLTLKNVGRRFSPEQLDNAEVHMFVGINNGGGYEYSDFGVWYVNDSNAPEQSVAITLNGFDALATRFEACFSDSEGSYPSTIGSLAQTVCVAAGIKIARTNFPNAAVQISKMPEWKEETTLRDVLSYCAVCAGGFARINRNGQLDIVSYSEGKNYTLGPGMYQTFTQTGGYAFRFNRIEAFMNEDDEERASFAVSSSIEPNATNTLQIDYNPLLTNTIMQSVVNELKDISLVAGELMWGGDPAVQLGDFYTLTDLKGNTHRIMVTNQSFNFGGGLNSVESCVLPALNSQNSATYSTSTNMYDAKGNIRATRISGLDKKVITATTGHFENLTAESAEIDNLLVSLLNAVNLIANMIDAKVIKAGSITAEQLSADAISAELIEAEALKAITAHIEKIVAGQITTDALYAALGKFDVLNAGTGYFDKATIQHLVSSALNLDFGVGNEVFIKNLKVIYAQMVSAAIGNLVIKASDGKYYEIDVDADGRVTASLSSVTDGEISAGQTDAGKVILGTEITAESLNTANLLATYALINKIDAARIDVDQLFAREAFVTKLTTSEIFGGESLTIIAGKVASAEDKATEALGSVNDSVARVDVQYYLSESATQLIGGTWQTKAPEWVNGKYMWSRTRTVLVDGTTRTSTATCIAGAKGDQGVPGPAGDPGPSGQPGMTSYFHIKYAPVQKPTASQMKETPDVYIGTYVDFIPMDSTDPDDYQWYRFQGIQGEQGEQGIPGIGKDGKTSYLHIKYSNNGGSSFTSNNGETVGSYIGQYVDYTEADSTNPADYKWAKIKGDQGIPGANGEDGRGIAAVIEQYYISTSNVAPIGGTWLDELPDLTNAADKYIWTRSMIVYDNGDIETTVETLNAAFEATKEFKRVVRIDDDGLHVGDNLTPCEVLIDSASVNVVQGGVTNATFAESFVRLQGMIIKSTTGGLAFMAYNE